MDNSLESFAEAVEAEQYSSALAISQCYDGTKNSWYWHQYANVLRNLKRSEASHEIRDILIKHSSAETQSWNQIDKGQLWRESGHYHKALSCFESATKLNPMEASAWIFMGAMQARFGFTREAEKSHRTATECETGFLDEAWHNLAMVLRAQCLFEEARECCLRSLDICVDENVQFVLNDIEKAIAFQKEHSSLLDKLATAGAGQADPKARATWHQLVRTTSGTEHLGKSLVLSQVHTRHLPADSDDDEFHRDLGYLENLWSVGKVEQTESFFQRLFLGTEDDRWYGFAQAGRMNAWLHRFDKAEESFLATHREDTEDNWALIELYIDSSQAEKAEQLCLELLSRYPDNSNRFVFYLLGLAYRSQLRFEEAATAFEDADGIRDSHELLADLNTAIEFLQQQ